MPTGYTAKLMEKGQEFPEFVMQCARAMGALIMMRDDPMDAPIPDKFEPSDYHTKRIDEATTRLATLEAMTNDEKIAEGTRLRANDKGDHEQWMAKEMAENDRLVAMEAKVQSWIPPTDDHDDFKNFMLDQLRISKHNLGYQVDRLNEINLKAPMEYFSEAVAKANRDIEYSKKELAKDVERNNGRTQWVKYLRDSLKSPQ